MDLKHEVSCGIIPVFASESGQSFLIVQNIKGGNWGFPKGHVEEGEEELETAKRELFEETGIQNIRLVGDLKYVENYQTRNSSGELVDKTVVLFVGFVENKEVFPQAKEIGEFKWVTYDEAMETFVFENPKRILTQVVKDLGKI